MEWYKSINYYHMKKQVLTLTNMIIREHPKVIQEYAEIDFLQLFYCNVRSFRPLHELQNLKYLSMVGCEVSDILDGNEHFEGVEYLHVCNQSGGDFKWLKCFPNLCELIIDQVNTDGKSIDVAPITKASKLKLLNITTPYEGFVELKNLWMLAALQLTDLTLDIAYDPKFISQFKELRSLCLYNNAVVRDFQFLLELQKLQNLTLGVEGYFDAAFLSQLPFLQEVKIHRDVYY